MSYYKDPEKMCKRFAVIQHLGAQRSSKCKLPIEIALLDIFNKTGCACGREFSVNFVEYEISASEDGITVNGLITCPSCHGELKVDMYVHYDEISEIYKQLGL